MQSYTIKDFHVGDKVLLIDCNYRSWSSTKRTMRETYVTNVGRTIITIDIAPISKRGYKYKINPRHGYGLISNEKINDDNMVFKSEQDYKEYCEYLELAQKFIRKINHLSTYSLTEDAMKKIMDIIDNEGSEE